MKNFLLFLFLAIGAHAQELVTATVTVIDLPNDGDSIVVNASTRRWTNSPINGVSWIMRTNSLGGTATNLYLHVAATPFTALTLGYSSSTAITLQGSAVNVSFGGTWASVAYATQAVTSMVNVRVPLAGLPAATNRTIIAGQLVTGISDYATNSFSASAAALTNYLSLGAQAQTAVGPKHFASLSGIITGLTNGVISGTTITNGILSGTVTALSGGTWTGAILQAPIFTNAINYGNPFHSPGLGNESLQLGQSAEAPEDNTTAVGDAAGARARGASAFGSQASVESTAPDGFAGGFKSSVTGGAGIAIGNFSDARKTNSMALGVRTISDYENSVAIANDTATTTNGQIRLGNSGHVLSVPGDGNFGQKVAIGSDNYHSWPSSLNRGIAFINGAGPDAQATNAWVLYSEAGQAFYRTGSTGEGAEANNRLHNRGATVTGTGTAYSFTGSTARIDYSGQDAELPLPSAGTYFVTAVVEIVNGATANDEYHVKFRNFEDDLDIADSERVISNLPVSAIGQIHMQNIVTVNDAKTIVVWGHNATAARGTSAAARTSLSYVRLY